MVITLPEATLEHIKKIDWFAHCGKPLTLPLTMDFQQIYSWEAAEAHWSDPNWGDTTLIARNEITAFLSLHHPEADRQWNTVVGSAQGWIKNFLYPSWGKVKSEHGFDDKFITDLRWTFLGILMEEAYRSFNHPSHFFAELLTVFEGGHYPCGWDGGDWPSGRLIIY